MKNTKILWLSLLLAVFAFAACDKEDDDPQTPQINEAEMLVTYLESANSPLGADYANTALPSITTAEAVRADVVAGTEMYLIDIRSSEDFGTGYIEGAVNVAAGEVLNYLETEGAAKGDKVVIVCYTGQTAGWVTSALRLSGYSEAYSMKWGMSAWHSDFAGKWQSNVSSMYSTQFEDDMVEKGAMGELPALNTGKSTGAEIFEARMATLMEEGFGAAKISNTVVFENPSNYYIVNYWADADYTHYGHIPGAMQYTPKSAMKMSESLKTLPTDKTIVVYCWTGQTSAFLTSYLRLLGYDAKSLLFGANGMIYNDLESHKWSDGEIKDYDYVN